VTRRGGPARVPRRALPAALIALAVTGWAWPAIGAPRKILVFAAEGTAEPGTRARLTTQVARLARGLGGEVVLADATFADTAVAVGCDPRLAGCGDDVMTTLGVDELIWTSATRDASQTRVVVRRVARGAAPRTLAIAFTTADPDARAQIDAALTPLFGASASPDPPELRLPPPSPPAPPDRDAAVVPTSAPPQPDDVRHDRNVAIALAAGAGVTLVLGVSLWASAASRQDQIDAHPTRTVADLVDLRALEDRASRYAISGDVAVLAGLALGGLGAYYLFRDHRPRVALRATPIAHGAVLTIELRGSP
jgi:hypothetical protein